MPTAESRRMLSEVTLSRQPENVQGAVFGGREATTFGGGRRARVCRPRRTGGKDNSEIQRRKVPMRRQRVLLKRSEMKPRPPSAWGAASSKDQMMNIAR